MTTLAKLLLGILLFFLLTHNETNVPNKEYVLLVEPVSTTTVSRSTKEKAFHVLENKCNVCHGKRNKKRVFTFEKMNPWAANIYKQVFIKKRMPKGNKIILTSEEYQELLTWITSTKNKI